MSDMQKFTNSDLVTYTKISSNKNSPRKHIIDTITIHCIVGQWTAKQGCDFFASITGASCNYVVGKDGSIGLCVDEKDRSWCSSNATNDHRAVTIEVASDTKEPYAVTDAAMKALIELVADICKRNNIKKLVWSTNKADRVNHKNGCNMTVHRDFEPGKSCPGEYLYNKHGFIANEVNKLLGATTENTTSSSKKTLYRIRKSWTDAASQAGAYYNLASAQAKCDACGVDYSVFDEQGNVVYPVKVNFAAGDQIKIGSGARYVSGAPIPNWVVNSTLYYRGEKDNGDIIFSTLKEGAITGVVPRKYVTKVEVFKPYLVKVTADSLNIRKGPGTNYAIIGKITNKGIYTIIEEKSGQGATKWLKLKSGAGFISSDYVQKQ